MDKLTILFPSDYFNNEIVDDDLKKEYESVMRTGLFNVILFSYDDWFNNGAIKLNTHPKDIIKAIYRGWMMTPDNYELFFSALRSNNIQLFTEPNEYKLMHAFPNVYPELKEDTAEMIVFPEGEKVDISVIKEHFDRFMIKDYVKSVKGSQFPKWFNSGLSQKELDEQLKEFRQFRGDLFTGGICIKKYVDLKHYDGQTNEYRVYYAKGNIVSICRNSLQQSFTIDPPKELISKYRSMNSPFYTIDFAEKEDGGWMIIETGDGQVSGLSEGQDYDAFYRALYYSMSSKENDYYYTVYDGKTDSYKVYDKDDTFFAYHDPRLEDDEFHRAMMNHDEPICPKCGRGRIICPQGKIAKPHHFTCTNNCGWYANIDYDDVIPM